MRDLDLSACLAISHMGAAVAEIAHLGAARWKKVVPFPAAAFAGAPFVHYRAEDAGGETWSPATYFGDALSLARVGSPSKIVVSGQEYLNCGLGCYDAVRTAGWPAVTPYSLWVLTDGGRPTPSSFYNGPAIGQANTTNTSSLFFHAPVARVFVGNAGYNAQWTLPAASAPESLEWTQPGGAAAALAQFLVYRNGAAAARAYVNNRSVWADGLVFVVGGARNASGVSVPSGLRIRDLVLTVGWTIGATQRAALEQYRQARLA